MVLNILFIQMSLIQKPLLNKNYKELANYLSNKRLQKNQLFTMYAANNQLKPSTNHSVGIKYQKVVSFVKDIPLKTIKQQEALNYIKKNTIYYL